MKKILQHLTSIALFILFPLLVFGQTHTWTGGHGKWTERSNWDSGAVPEYGHEAIINEGIPSISSGEIVYVSHIEISKNGGLIVNLGGHLHVEKWYDEPGIVNFGTIDIFGKVSIYGVKGAWNIAHGLETYGTVFIESGGELNCNKIEGKGINIVHGTFENNGNVIVSETVIGVDNDGTFTNNGLIDISDMVSSPRNGLENRNIFENGLMGAIRIRNAGLGLINYDDATFNNYNKINVWDCSIGLNNPGTFYNRPRGNVAAFQNDRGATVSAQGRLINESTMILENNNFDGLNVYGYVENHGFITASYNGENGISASQIWPNVTPTIINYDDIQAIDNGQFCISLHESELINTDDGFISTEGNLSGDEIINEGMFAVWGMGPHIVTFDNQGILQDLHNSLDGVVDNNQVILRPMQGPLVNGVPVTNAIEIASTSNVAIGRWYNALARGRQVGTYTLNNNSFTPNWRGAGRSTVFAWTRILSSGNGRRFQINVNQSGGGGGALIKSNTTEEIAPDELDGLSLSIFPNPVSGSFKIQGVQNVERVIMFGSDGQKIPLNNQNSLDNEYAIPADAPLGSYQVLILRSGKRMLTRTIVVQR